MGKWIVVDTADLKPGDICPTVHATTSEERASQWIGNHGDPDKCEQGHYGIDESPMTGEEQAAWIEQVAKDLGLTLEWEFVPFSHSRHKGDKQPSLNYRVSLRRHGAVVLVTDYTMGCAHAPSYKQRLLGRGMTVEDQERWEAVKAECETGFAHSMRGFHHAPLKTRKPIAPEFAQVINSLVLDSEVIDYGDFEEWADSIGYDTDSRSAEKTYRACLETGLKLRNALGEDGLAKLREACEGY